MGDYHEPESELSARARDLHRALTSFKEEIEAIDWYNQRVERCSDEALRAVLAHNRDEEIEHATMTLEWLRRNMPGWDEALRTYLFTEGAITEIEEAKEAAEALPAGKAVPVLNGRPALAARNDLGIGSQRRAR
jgi:ferritin-like protein